MKMSDFRKTLCVLICIVFSTECKVNKSDKVLPIEVTLGGKSEDETLSSESTIFNNKAVELEIRSDRQENGKVDLIIAASKEVKASERKDDRYSPAFNGEHGLLNDNDLRDLRSLPKLEHIWGSSRQDSPFLYPQQSVIAFPLQMLRQGIQTPQPLLPRQNQFSPFQTLRHFEHNLQRQLLPHTNQAIGSVGGIPMNLVLSQPIFTSDAAPDKFQEQRVTNAPLALSLLQQELLKSIRQNNKNVPLNSLGQLPLIQTLPLNRYPQIKETPQNLYAPNGQNFLQINSLSNSLQEPVRPYADHKNIQPLLRQQSHVPHSIPNLLGPNKLPLPIQDRPVYTLDRNINNISPSPHRYENQRPLSHQHGDINQNVAQLANNGIRIYQYKPHEALPYHRTASDKPREHLYNPSQPALSHQRQSLPRAHPEDSPLDNKQHFQGTQPAHQPYQDRYGPIKEYDTRFLNQRNVQDSNRQPITENYQNPAIRDQPLRYESEDYKKLPPQRYFPDAAKHIDSHNPPRSSEEDYPKRYQKTRAHHLPHSHHPPSQQGYSGHHEPYYESRYRNTETGIADADEDHQTDSAESLSKYKENYASTTPKKSKRRKKTKSKEKGDDLEGQSSHQYRIKIG